MRWKRVGLFLALAFGLAWLLDLVLWLSGELRVPAATLVLQAQMLLPALSAILVGLFCFTNSPVYIRTNHSLARLFLYYYLLLTVVYVAFALASFATPQLLTMTGALSLLLSVLGLLLVIVLRFVSGRPAYARLGLAGAPLKYWLLFRAGVVLFYALQTALNYVFGLGEFVDVRVLLPQQTAPALSPVALRAALAVNTVLIGPFLGLVLAFGEEYGWRGFLQGGANQDRAHQRHLAAGDYLGTLACADHSDGV